MRTALANAAGLPLASVLLVGVHCSGSGDGDLLEFPVLASDAVNTYSGSRALRRASDVASGASSSAASRARRLTTVGMAINLILFNFPNSSAGLGGSSVGLLALSTLSAADNIAARLLALTGALPASYLAAAAALGINASASLDTSAALAAFVSVSAAWASASGQNASAVTAGLASVTTYTAPSTPTSTSQDLRYVAGIVIGGLAAIAVVVVGVVMIRRRRRNNSAASPLRSDLD